MLKHYLITTFRNLKRSKLFTAINVLGLSISIIVFLALSEYVNHQFSYDKFYEDGDRIYRIDYYEYQAGEPILQSARTFDKTALLVHEFVPQVEAVTRIYHEKAYIFTEDAKLTDQDMIFADCSFIKVFKLNLLSGSDQALTPPNSVLISKSQAAVYFGDEDPMGKTLYFNEHLPIIVTGVFDDIPTHSSVDFDFLISWSTLWYYGWVPREGSFEYPWTFTFVKLRKHVTDLNAIDNQLTAMVTNHVTTLEKRGHTARQQLRPYEELHFASGLSGELKPGINIMLLFALLALGVFILIAAWINYINLSFARSLERADEIGVRKVFGASRLLISGQFIWEAFLLAIITFIVGYGTFALLGGPLSNLIFADMVIPLPKPGTSVFYFVAFVLITTLVAFYPAHVISKYKPALILKNKITRRSRGAYLLQDGLMVFQLFMAIAIMAISYIAVKQLAFIRHFDSGFNAAQTITLRAPASTNSDSLRYSRYTSFRNDVLQQTGFLAGTASMNIPGEEIRFHDEGVHAIGSDNIKKQSYQVMWVDEGYQQTFGLSLLAGRNFNPQEKDRSCIINETAARALGYTNPADAINTSIINQEKNTIVVVGVWRDYHHQSLRKPLEPTVFYYRHPHEYGYYSFQLETRDPNSLEVLAQVWKKHYPNDTFTYYFMDNFFAEQYKSDQLFSRLLNLFSVIALIVAWLGLFGMATLAMVQRTKEIGIRKVLGASIANILILLSTRYFRLIGMSCVFAFPVSYYLTNAWLAGFAYKISIEWWMIVLPGIFVLFATLLAISTQSVRAALTNPTDTLKDQ